MKKVHLIFFLLFLLLKCTKGKNCSWDNVKRKSFRNNVVHSNILEASIGRDIIRDGDWHGGNEQMGNKDGLVRNKSKCMETKRDGNVGSAVVAKEREGRQKQSNNPYSFTSLQVIPFVVNSLIHTGISLIPRNVEEKHMYNFEKSPTVRYLLLAEGRKNSFLFIIFLILAFAVVVLASFFVFKFFFKL
ncbi:hypothetical protein POVWA2_032070 [Plasmodium ovale wallikeri]|uniref:Apical rhoptry neck protein n=1 Tax=Plasmodium ovale wallikeri TaxID=864142 RepID=A0A1A8YXK4_PLAOA|nr:hypothetical protein POVWA1_032460 [Plasmodium ovale wallikeri]SBT36822.1 hypothetical protein POVWA2_032070 [Plasmodium ovale wallikeri]